MLLSFKTPTHLTDWTALRAMWREADTMLVFHGGWAFDHLYPWRADPTGPCLEGWTLLSALAVETQRLRLGLLVTSNAYRHPAVLAKMATTVDIISAGRLDLGIGAGGDVAESEAYGLPLPGMARRIDQLEEACQVLRVLFSQDVADFQGRHYRLQAARCEPKPLQQPRPPLIIGGAGDRLLSVVARCADGWNFPGGSPDAFSATLARLRAQCRRLGRDPEEISVSAQLNVSGSPNAIADAGSALVQAGAAHVVLVFQPPFSVHDLVAAGRAFEPVLS